MKYFSADLLIPVSAEPIPNGVIQIDDDGTIIGLGKKEDFPSVDIKYMPGIILPGFVNTHCHLELSHMKGICDSGTGLIAFITKVVSLRDFERELILDAIKTRDEEMYASGIQAVGDICNKVDTAECKDNSPIHYYSFIELFDLMQASMTRSVIENYSSIFKAQSDKGMNRKSFVPHAPYSVTPDLYKFINTANTAGSIISIHNQETADESALFLKGGGGFKAFYKSLGMNLDAFQPTGDTSLAYALEHLQPGEKTLLVHNTLSTPSDIELAQNWSDHVYWVTCPNANLYIENRLPCYKYFMESNAKLCMGTDSIMSNWQLCIWEELKTIKKYQSYIPLEELIRWATLNGAEALGYDSVIGSLEPGKKPGLVSIDLKWAGEATLLDGSHPVRIA